MTTLTPEQVDALLPQTQCGLCGYGGCMPYAEAIVFEKAPIHLCPPGGVKTLQQLGELTQQDPTPFMNEMQEKAKTKKLLAVIREDDCIGCTKCIQACPVDAIMGSSKTMHTIIASECTGCELCVPPCPVDCIDLLIQPANSETQEIAQRQLARTRFNARQNRLNKENTEKRISKQNTSLNKRKHYIQAAIARTKAKKQCGSDSI